MRPAYPPRSAFCRVPLLPVYTKTATDSYRQASACPCGMLVERLQL